MKSQLPLDVLKQLAQDDVDCAARKLGMMRAQRNEAERQLQALLDYRHEYRTKLQAATQSGIAASGWRNFQQFIETLDTAIAKQRDLLVQASERVAACQREWQQHKRRFNSFDTLATRAADRENQRLARLEQRENDEYAARLARLRSSAFPQ